MVITEEDLIGKKKGEPSAGTGRGKETTADTNIDDIGRR